jgi:hypothetical protein
LVLNIYSSEEKENIMYKDIISYQLAEGITKEHLLNVAQHIIDD